MKLLWRLAQSGVILLDEVPANLILGEVAAWGTSSSRIGWARGSWVLLSVALELILLREVAIGRHIV